MHELFKHPLEVGERVGTMHADLLDEGVDHGTAPVDVFATDEHPVLVAQFGGADRVFWSIPLRNWTGDKDIELDSRLTSARRE